MNNNIVLTGFMGAGKTTVGAILADTLGYSFVETDRIVEKEANMIIKDIFDTHGEAHFRELEHQALKKAMSGNRQIISTGGGIVTNSKNRELLKGQDVVYLYMSPEVIYKRLENDTTRPLARNISIKKIIDLLGARERYYLECCSEEVDGEGTPDSIANEIIGTMIID